MKTGLKVLSAACKPTGIPSNPVSLYDNTLCTIWPNKKAQNRIIIIFYFSILFKPRTYALAVPFLTDLERKMMLCLIWNVR